MDKEPESNAWKKRKRMAKESLKMKTYEITIQTVILEEDNKEDAENTFLSMMEEGYLEYEIKEDPTIKLRKPVMS